jgi:hypothetical protein
MIFHEIKPLNKKVALPKGAKTVNKDALKFDCLKLLFWDNLKFLSF